MSGDGWVNTTAFATNGSGTTTNYVVVSGYSPLAGNPSPGWDYNLSRPQSPMEWLDGRVAEVRGWSGLREHRAGEMLVA